MLHDVLVVSFTVMQVVLFVLSWYFILKVIIILFTFTPLYKGDVPYVPTDRKLVKKGFDLLNIKKGDRVIDLGSGDGQFLLYTARRVEAEITGVELNTFLLLLSKVKLMFSTKKGMVTINRVSFWDVKLGDYNKIFLFNMPSVLKKLAKKMDAELKAGTLIASIMFPIMSTRLELIDAYDEKNSKKKVFLYKAV